LQTEIDALKKAAVSVTVSDDTKSPSELEALLRDAENKIDTLKAARDRRAPYVSPDDANELATVLNAAGPTGEALIVAAQAAATKLSSLNVENGVLRAAKSWNKDAGGLANDSGEDRLATGELHSAPKVAPVTATPQPPKAVRLEVPDFTPPVRKRTRESVNYYRFVGDSGLSKLPSRGTGSSRQSLTTDRVRLLLPIIKAQPKVTLGYLANQLRSTGKLRQFVPSPVKTVTAKMLIDAVRVTVDLLLHVGCLDKTPMRYALTDSGKQCTGSCKRASYLRQWVAAGAPTCSALELANLLGINSHSASALLARCRSKGLVGIFDLPPVDLPAVVNPTERVRAAISKLPVKAPSRPSETR